MSVGASRNEQVDRESGGDAWSFYSFFFFDGKRLTFRLEQLPALLRRTPTPQFGAGQSGTTWTDQRVFRGLFEMPAVQFNSPGFTRGVERLFEMTKPVDAKKEKREGFVRQIFRYLCIYNRYGPKCPRNYQVRRDNQVVVNAIPPFPHTYTHDAVCCGPDKHKKHASPHLVGLEKLVRVEVDSLKRVDSQQDRSRIRVDGILRVSLLERIKDGRLMQVGERRKVGHVVSLDDRRLTSHVAELEVLVIVLVSAGHGVNLFASYI